MLLSENKLSTRLLLTIVFALTLPACATDQSVPPMCPQAPDLPTRVQPGPSFQDQMQSFLSGKLPEQMSSGQGLSPATR